MYHGPYALRIGCTDMSVTFSDVSFDTYESEIVGNSVTGIYSFNLPTSTRTYCVITAQEIVLSSLASQSSPVYLT
jgi:hypothetical protein